MGWFSDFVDSVSDAFSGDSSSSSSSSSSGYEEAAYGGSKTDYYNALGGQSDSDSDSSQLGSDQKIAQDNNYGSDDGLLGGASESVTSTTPTTVTNAAGLTSSEIDALSGLQGSGFSFDVMGGINLPTVEEPQQQFNPNVGAPTVDSPELFEQISSLESQLETSNQDLSIAQNDLAAMEAQYGTASAQYEAALEQVSGLEETITGLSGERDSLQEQLANQPFEIVKQEAIDRGFVDPTNELIAQYENPLDYLADAELLSQATTSEGNEIDLTDKNLYSQASQFREQMGEDTELYVDESGKVYGQNNASLLGATEMFGTQLGNSILGFFGGLLGGNIAYALTGSNATALQTAQLGNQALKGFQPLKSDVYVDLDGNEYVKASAFGNETFLTREEVEANAARARDEANMWAENSDADDIAGSMASGMAVASGGRSKGWKDYYKAGDIVDLEQIAFDTIRGVADASDIKSVEFGTRVALGDDVVTTAFDVYGDAVRDILPEGYEKPTEAAIRIGLGEDRVAVLGDVYGDEIGIDTPIEKAALEGANTYDQTGDKDKALGTALYTYYKEGGKFPDFEAPDFLGDVNLNVDLSFLEEYLPDVDLFGLKDFGVNISDLFGQGMDWIKLKAKGVDFPDLQDLGIDLKDINFEGVDFFDAIDSDLDLTLPEMRELGIDTSMPDIALDMGLDIALNQGGRKGLPSGDDEFVSLDYDPILMPEKKDSLARELLGMAQRKA